MNAAHSRPRCFVARPISPAKDHDYRDRDEHWQHVHDELLAPAIGAAGYEVVPPTAAGSTIIHAAIIGHLHDCELVVADFSTLNPNVLFEAGIRTAIGKPLVIVAEHGTRLPFDTNSVNTVFYDPDLNSWDLRAKIDELKAHITKTDTTSNALWKHFGVQLRSATLDTETNPESARLEVLTEQVNELTELVTASFLQMSPSLQSRSDATDGLHRFSEAISQPHSRPEDLDRLGDVTAAPFSTKFRTAWRELNEAVDEYEKAPTSDRAAAARRRMARALKLVESYPWDLTRSPVPMKERDRILHKAHKYLS